MEKNITLTVRSKTIVEQCPLHWSSNTVDYITATFDLDEEWSECDVVKAVWSGRRATIVTLLDANNTCVVPHEVLATVGKVMVNLTGTVYESGEEFTRITTYPFNAITIDATAKVDGDETAPVTPSQFDQYVEAVKSETEKVTGMTAVAETLPTGSDATASYSDGVLTLGIPRGDKGETGERGERGERGLTGETGATGNGIESVTKTGTSGLVDTYTITFTDGTSTTFTVTNGQDGSGAVDSVNGKTGDVTLTASDIGLGNVDNTSDSDKPISTAVQNALDAKVSSVNGETPDTNGNVEIDATDIETSNGVAVKSVNGNLITITDALYGKALGVTATLEPIQDLHGYDHPWAGGAGKNKYSGGTVVTVNNKLFENVEVAPIPAGTYTLSAVIGSEPTGYNGCRIAFRKADGSGIEAVNLPYTANARTSITFTLSDTCAKIYFYYSATTSGTGNQTYTNVQIEEGSTATAYEPYSNICPINGRTQVEITNKDSEDVEQASVTVDLGQTVYGGTLNVTTGELTVETANIASYNGETIGEPWLSSMDEYVAGATPTTGAQVVYTLATPTTVSLTPAQVNLLTGTNIISTNADDLLIRYYASDRTGNVEGSLAYLFEKIEEILAQINA